MLDKFKEEIKILIYSYNISKYIILLFHTKILKNLNLIYTLLIFYYLSKFSCVVNFYDFFIFVEFFIHNNIFLEIPIKSIH